MNKRNPGLTLIEVLVFVGIIIVAVLVIMPAIQRAQEEKRKSLCQDTLRRWGQAFSMYANEDPEQKFPPIQMVNSEMVKEGAESIDCLELHFVPQPDLLYPELIDNLGVLYCSSDPEAEEDVIEVSENGLEGLFGEFKRQHFSYIYFGWAFDRLKVDPPQPLDRYPVLSEELREPSPADIYVTPQFACGIEVFYSPLFEAGTKTVSLQEYLAMADSDLEVTAPLGNSGGNTIRRLGKGVERFLVTDPDDTNAMKECASKIATMMDAYGKSGVSTLYFNHIPGGSNVLYMDGHVEFVRFVGSPSGPGIDAGSTAPVLQGMAPIVSYIGRLGSGRSLRFLLQQEREIE